ncbi:hypothetical protein HK101_003005 [Irineochytrium annulatum]|nr:hypothetical protein HK101_003005 [Irineochytrium annulatum]
MTEEHGDGVPTAVGPASLPSPGEHLGGDPLHVNSATSPIDADASNEADNDKPVPSHDSLASEQPVSTVEALGGISESNLAGTDAGAGVGTTSPPGNADPTNTPDNTDPTNTIASAPAAPVAQDNFDTAVASSIDMTRLDDSAGTSARALNPVVETLRDNDGGGEALPSYTFAVLEPPKYDTVDRRPAFIRFMRRLGITFAVVVILIIALSVIVPRIPRRINYSDFFTLRFKPIDMTQGLHALITSPDGYRLFGVSDNALAWFTAMGPYEDGSLVAKYEGAGVIWPAGSVVACTNKNLYVVAPSMHSDGNQTLYVWDPTMSMSVSYNLPILERDEPLAMLALMDDYLLVATFSGLFLVSDNATQHPVVNGTQPIAVHNVTLPEPGYIVSFLEEIRCLSSMALSYPNLIITAQSEMEVMLYHYVLPPSNSTPTTAEFLQALSNPAAALNLTEIMFTSFTKAPSGPHSFPVIVSLSVNQTNIAIVYRFGDFTGFIYHQLHAITSAVATPTPTSMSTPTPTLLTTATGKRYYSIAWGWMSPLVLESVPDDGGGPTTVNVYDFRTFHPINGLMSAAAVAEKNNGGTVGDSGSLTGVVSHTSLLFPTLETFRWQSPLVTANQYGTFKGAAFGASAVDPFTIIGFPLHMNGPLS